MTQLHTLVLPRRHVASNEDLTRPETTRGNRMLNQAIHTIVICQLRHPHTECRAFYERKRAQGTTRKEAIRSLKRRISYVVNRHLVDGQTS